MSGPALPLIATLRRLLHPPPTGGRCDLCDAPLTEPHTHVVDTHQRRLLCACVSCGAAGGPEHADVAHDEAGRDARYKPVAPARAAAPWPIAAAHWQALEVPVDLAFFFLNSTLGRVVAFYPGPAGASEALPPAAAWRALAKAHPWVENLVPDVEALLARRSGGEYRAYRVPIDACYELVGRIRVQWTGMDGGRHVREEIDAFFEGLATGPERSGAGGGSQ